MHSLDVRMNLQRTTATLPLLLTQPKDTLRTEAELWVYLLSNKLASAEEIIGWCDHKILQLDDPPAQLLELSMSKQAHWIDIIHFLHEIPGEFERSFYIRRGMEELSRLNRCCRFQAYLIHSLIHNLIGHEHLYNLAQDRPEYLQDIQAFGAQDDLRYEAFRNRSDEEQRDLNQHFLDEWLRKYSL